ncbi:MAG: hypothetical protein IJR47_04385, partial [Clostridia bacterium]|nr:hypothetical protein [Clostridia bacterium]
LSCFDKRDTHILGYNINWQDNTFKSRLKELQSLRQSRMEQMVQGLIEDGFEISMEEVKARCCGRVMGRPHVAAVMVEKGYGKTTRDIFNKYIGNGCKYYVKYKKLEVKEGIDLIHSAGGYAVLAHPRLLRYNAREFTPLLKQYKELGLNGIEAYYPCHKNEDIRLYQSLAKELDLFVTCGGDFHNPEDPTKNTLGFNLKDLPGVEKTLKLLLGKAD